MAVVTQLLAMQRASPAFSEATFMHRFQFQSSKKKKQFSRYRTFSFLIVRTVDRARKFHVLAYACVTNETSLDYEFLFKTMIVAVKIIHNVQLNPNVLLADGDRAIRNGFVASFLNVDANVICARANKCK